MKAQRVYFMRQKGVARGPIKIGCSTCVQSRLENLSVWSPVRLEVAAAFPGNFNAERRIHALFWSDHSHHEWFNWSPELEALIASVNDGSFDLDSLPAGEKRAGPRAGMKWTPEQKAVSAVKSALRKIEKETGLVPPRGVYDYYITYPDDAPKKELLVAFLSDPASNGITRKQLFAEYDLERAAYHREQARKHSRAARALSGDKAAAESRAA